MIKNLSIVGLLSFLCSFAIAQVSTYPSSPATPALPDANMPITEMEFEENVFEFGTIMEGEKIKNVFVFTNTGKEPLVISNAKGSCGCTVPEWPREPIMPGESGQLLVQFDSKGKGKVGGNLQSKRVTITANTDPMNTYITIKGKVDKPEQLGEEIFAKGKPIDIKFGKLSKENSEEEVEKIVEEERVENPEVDESKVLFYPNPTDGELRIGLQEFGDVGGSIEIYSGKGEKVEERKIDSFKEELLFNVADYAAGIYTVSIKIDGKNRIAKRFFVPKR